MNESLKQERLLREKEAGDSSLSHSLNDRAGSMDLLKQVCLHYFCNYSMLLLCLDTLPVASFSISYAPYLWFDCITQSRRNQYTLISMIFSNEKKTCQLLNLVMAIVKFNL